MIHYPNGKKAKSTSSGSSSVHANRGLSFESEIDVSNEYYRRQNQAVIYKKPTPIKVVRMGKVYDKEGIVEAYFQAPSTTDYNGLYRGQYIDFEAKETKNKTSFPLANIHPHQLNHMEAIVHHGGIGFLLVYFKTLGKVYLLDYRELMKVTHQHQKSIPYSLFLEKGHEVPQGYIIPIDYLKVVDNLYFSK